MNYPNLVGNNKCSHSAVIGLRRGLNMHILNIEYVNYMICINKIDEFNYLVKLIARFQWKNLQFHNLSVYSGCSNHFNCTLSIYYKAACRIPDSGVMKNMFLCMYVPPFKFICLYACSFVTYVHPSLKFICSFVRSFV